MELLLEKTPPEDVRSDVLPMVYRALESGVSQIQELCLSIIPSFAGRFSGLFSVEGFQIQNNNSKLMTSFPKWVNFTFSRLKEMKRVSLLGYSISHLCICWVFQYQAKIISHWIGLLDRQNLKAALLPRIKSLCTSTTLLSVRQVYSIRLFRL